MSVHHLASDDQLEALLSAGAPVVIDFSASWCGPCKAYAPVFEAVAGSVPAATFAKADVDDVPQLAQRFSVMSVPTTVVVEPSGEIRARAVGALPEHQLRALLA